MKTRREQFLPRRFKHCCQLLMLLALGSAFVPMASLYAADGPHLSIPSDPVAVAEGYAAITIQLSDNGTALGAIGFSLDVDPQCLLYNPADEDNNGVPDAITRAPPGFSLSALYNVADTDGELDIGLYDVSLPIGTLPSGTLLTIAFEVLPSCNPSSQSQVETTLAFATSPSSSFATTGGARVEGTVTGATIPLVFGAAPTDLTLSANTIPENAPIGTEIGTLQSVDPDVSDTHTYAIVANIADADAFTVSGNRLLTAMTFDFEVRDSYSVRLRTTDSTSLSHEAPFAVHVTNVNEAPVAVDDVVDPATQVFAGSMAAVDVLANDADPDADTTLTIVGTSPPAAGTATTDGAVITFDPPDTTNGMATFNYTVRDNHPTAPLTDAAMVTLTYVANDARGDCNADLRVDAADLVASVLEIFDSPTSAPWYSIYAAGFAGSPRGCDSNADLAVASSDIICTVRLMFNEICGPTSRLAATPAQTAGPTLEVTSEIATEGITEGTTEGITVTVALAGGDDTVAATAFTLRYDPTVVVMDASDADGDGLPDAAQIRTTAAQQAWLLPGDAGRWHFAVVASSLPITPLADGTLVTFRLTRVAAGDPQLTLTQVSAGDTLGQALTLEVNVVPPTEVTEGDTLLFLPGLQR